MLEEIKCKRAYTTLKYMQKQSTIKSIKLSIKKSVIRYYLFITYRVSDKDLTNLKNQLKNKKWFLSTDFWMLLCISQSFYWLLEVFKITTMFSNNRA